MFGFIMIAFSQHAEGQRSKGERGKGKQWSTIENYSLGNRNPIKTGVIRICSNIPAATADGVYVSQLKQCSASSESPS
jgi:hypothetical protein